MDPVLIDLVYVKIYWYSVIVMTAFLIGGFLVLKEARKFDIDDETIVNYVFFLVPIALIGARFYYVAFNWSLYQGDFIEILKVWEGGLAIHGGIIFGFLWTWFFAKTNKIKTLRFMDIIAPALVLGQGIGRWGNFFNQEAHGPATTLEKLQSLYLPDFIIQGMKINGTYYQPTFLYEFIWCFIGFLFLLLVRRFSRYLKVGQLAGLGLIWLGIGRFFIEDLRQDSLIFNDLQVAQIFSGIIIFIGLILFFRGRKKSRFEDLYHDKEEIVDPFELARIREQDALLEVGKSAEKELDINEEIFDEKK